MDLARIRRTSCQLAVIALAVAHPASAQTLELPPANATTAGTGSTNVPFGRSIPTRLQCVYDAAMFAAAPVTFSTIRMRVDEGLTALSKVVDLEIVASSSALPVTGVQTSFAANRGPDETVVFARKIFSLPDAGSAADPNAFDVAFPLDTSFTFDPTAAGSLVIEFVVHGQPPGAYTIDTAFVCDSPRTGYGPAGCGPSGGPVLKADSLTTQVTWGSLVNLRVYDATPSSTTALSFGYLESGRFLGLDLPFELGVIGAPGCHLAIDARFSFTTMADAAGTGLFTIFLPSNPNLVGQWIRFQGFSLDPTANALGVTSSQPYKIQVCGWEPVARVFANGLASATGVREIGVAPVLQLQ